MINLVLFIFFSIFPFIFIFSLSFLYFGLRQRVLCNVSCDGHKLQRHDRSVTYVTVIDHTIM